MLLNINVNLLKKYALSVLALRSPSHPICVREKLVLLNDSPAFYFDEMALYKQANLNCPLGVIKYSICSVLTFLKVQ